MNQKVTLKEVSSIQREVEVVINAQEVLQALDDTYKRIGSKAKINGFRPGKIPRNVLEQYFKVDAENDTLRDLVQKSYPVAIQEVGIMPIAQPEIKVTQFAVGQDFTYQAVFEVPPKIEPKGYTDLELEKESAEATDKDVEDNLKALQERMTQLVPLESPRSANGTDVVIIDYVGTHEGKSLPGFDGKAFVVELGKNYIFPEIETALVGMSPEEKKQVSVTLPENWVDKTLGGKKIDYEIVLKEIKGKKVPEINDDLAKDLGQFATLDELKTKIKEDVSKSKEQAVKGKLKRDVVEKLIKANEFEVPQALVNFELEDMFRRYEGNIRSQGLTLEQIGVTPQMFVDQNKDEAAIRVKGALIFDAIAQKESVKLTPEELDAKIDEMAQGSGQTGAAWKKYFQDNNLLGRVAGGILEEKALDFVLSKSKIKNR